VLRNVEILLGERVAAMERAWLWRPGRGRFPHRGIPLRWPGPGRRSCDPL